MAADPLERTNLVDEGGQAEVVHDLRSRLDRWFLRYIDPVLDGARMPVTGSGQRDLAGPGNGGRLAFEQGQRRAQDAKSRM